MRLSFSILASTAALGALLPHNKRDPGTLQGRAALTPPATLPGSYQYAGCYKDSGERRLDGARYDDTANMTDESCVAFCSSKGFPLAGVEYAQECYCGYQFKSGAVKLDESSCNMACPGNAAEPCGGGFAFTLYNNSAAPQVRAAANGFASQGCYTDSANRVLTHAVHTPETAAQMTVELCTAACAQQGYSVAGVEYGGECWCDSKLGSAAQLKTDGTCNMPCNGDKTEFCGGPYRLNVYAKPATTTTTTTTTVAPTTATTKATATPTPTGHSKSNRIDCGSFESGGTCWSIEYRTGTSNLQALVGNDNVNSHTAPGYATVRGSLPASDAARGACFTQKFWADDLVSGNYTLEYFAGSYDQYAGLESARPAGYNVTVRASINNGYATYYEDLACRGRDGSNACTVSSDAGGPAPYPQYKPYSHSFYVPSRTQYTLKICADYVGPRTAGREDLFFLDDVYLSGPY